MYQLSILKVNYHSSLLMKFEFLGFIGIDLYIYMNTKKMRRQELIEKAVLKIKQLPDNKIEEINDFVDFLITKIDDQIIMDNIQQLSSESTSFDFLNEEEDLYNVSDLKEYYK